MVVSVVPPNPIIIIILSPSREVRRERRAPIIKSTIHKFLSALSSPHGSRRLLPSSAASVVSRGPCLCRALSFTVARETETRAPPHSLHYEPLEQRESGTVRSPRGMSDRDRTVRKEEGSDGSGRSFLCHSAPSSIPTSLRSVVMMR